MISVKELELAGIQKQTAKNLIATAKNILVSEGNEVYNNKKMSQVPQNVIESLLGTPVTKENFATADTLEKLGLSTYQSKEIIRIIKYQLSQEFFFYSNKKVNLVPRIAVDNYLGNNLIVKKTDKNSLLEERKIDVHTPEVRLEPNRSNLKTERKTKKRDFDYVFERTDNKTKSTVIYYEIHACVDPITGKRKKLKSQFDSNGNPFLSHKDAYLAALEAKEEYLNATNVHATLKDFSEQLFLSDYKRNVKTRTYETAIGRLKIINKQLGNKKLKDITKVDIQHFKNFLIDTKKYSSGYANSVLGLLKQVLNFAIEYDYLEKNVAAGIAIKKTRSKIEYWTKSDKDRVVSMFDTAHLDEHLSATAIEVSFNTGIRPNECLALEWNDLDIENKTLNIWGTLVKEIGNELYKQHSVKTTSSVRTIPISDSTLKILETWKAHQQSENIHSKFIFSKNGKPMYSQTIAKKLKDTAKKINISEIPLKNLRHSFATYARYKLKCPIQDIADIMGHSSVTITEKYYIQKPKVATRSIANRMNQE